MKVNWKLLREVLGEARDVSEYELAVFNVSPLLDERVKFASQVKKMRDEAICLKRNEGVPFWDGFLLRIAHSGNYSEQVLASAMLHQSANRVYRLSVQSLLSGDVPDVQLCSGEILTLSSKCVNRSGALLHLPMLDYHLPFGANRTRLIMKVTETLEQTGLIVRSGKSFHFYGNSLLDEAGWRIFMGKALLLSPIVDRNWIAHQLIQGFCALRISSSPYYSELPKVWKRVQ
jgi:hypothetical protein